MRMQKALGNLGERVGAYFLGGFALTLRHRHDIRVGIASGMFLKAMIQDVPTRLEILAVLYLCPWRWPTKVLLETVAARMGEYLRGNSACRADILEVAWRAMEAKMADYHVVEDRRRQTVRLASSAEAQALLEVSGKAGFIWHPCQRPVSHSSGRLASDTYSSGRLAFDTLLGEVRSGSLRRLCVALASGFARKPCYVHSEQLLQKFQVSLFAGSTLERTRSRRAHDECRPCLKMTRHCLSCPHPFPPVDQTFAHIAYTS